MHKPHPRRTPARQRLLSAAARVFARDGLDGATTRAISKEAGVNEVTLFRNFGTKEHLLEAVVGSAFAPAARASAPPAGRGDLRADLASFAEAYEALLLTNLPLIRAVIGEIHRHALCEHQALKGIFQPMREALIRRLEDARRSGEARAATDPVVSADLFAGMVFSAVLRRSTLRRRLEYGSHAYRDACVDVLARGIA
ncbi:MAG TPA: TetR/AcrR family transcriptional regulator [Opitutaceae bacterium]